MDSTIIKGAKSKNRRSHLQIKFINISHNNGHPNDKTRNHKQKQLKIPAYALGFLKNGVKATKRRSYSYPGTFVKKIKREMIPRERGKGAKSF